MILRHAQALAAFVRVRQREEEVPVVGGGRHPEVCHGVARDAQILMERFAGIDEGFLIEIVGRYLAG